jgi:hypothetical protein
MRNFRKMLSHARSGMTLSVGLVITIFLVFILGAAVLPTAFSQWFNASTTGWPTATQTLWPLVPLLGVIVLIAIIAKKASDTSKHEM